ncbi:MAG: hypothetical protein J6K50_03990, partial [Clostridia bacterium]|nr:hypothetical protein [Clostridia bacterium]
MSAKEQIFERFLDGTLAGKTASEICKLLKLPYREKARLTDLLNELVEEEKLYLDDGGRYGTSEQLGLIKGVVSGNERGFGFLMPEDRETYPDDFFIPRRKLRGALHGDRVLAMRTYGAEGDEVSVVKILERGYPQIVGTFRRDNRAGY